MVLHEPSARGAELRSAPSIHGGRPECDVVEVLADVARALTAERSVERVLGRICAVAVAFVPGCEHASISIVRGRRIETVVSTDDAPRPVDAIRYGTDEGPCLDALREHEMFGIGDLSSEDRWSRFATRASETEVRSTLSLPLYVGDETYGASTCTPASPTCSPTSPAPSLAPSPRTGPLRWRERTSARRPQNLERAVESRDVIGQAKGILMHKRGMTADQAFDMLVKASQHLNRRLRDVAEQVALTGNDPSEIG